MAKTMKTTAAISVAATIIFSLICWKSNWGFAFSAAITFGTIAYHLVIRLLVGTLVDCVLHNHVDYNKKWFQVHPLEMKIYNRPLLVKLAKRRQKRIQKEEKAGNLNG